MKTSPASLPTHATFCLSVCPTSKSCTTTCYTNDWSTLAPSTSASSRRPLLELDACSSPCWRNCTPFTTKSFVLTPPTLMPFEWSIKPIPIVMSALLIAACA